MNQNFQTLIWSITHLFQKFHENSPIILSYSADKETDRETAFKTMSQIEIVISKPAGESWHYSTLREAILPCTLWGASCRTCPHSSSDQFHSWVHDWVNLCRFDGRSRRGASCSPMTPDAVPRWKTPGACRYCFSSPWTPARFSSHTKITSLEHSANITHARIQDGAEKTDHNWALISNQIRVY